MAYRFSPSRLIDNLRVRRRSKLPIMCRDRLVALSRSNVTNTILKQLLLDSM